MDVHYEKNISKCSLKDERTVYSHVTYISTFCSALKFCHVKANRAKGKMQHWNNLTLLFLNNEHIYRDENALKLYLFTLKSEGASKLDLEPIPGKPAMMQRQILNTFTAFSCKHLA